jgi:hypothetical protein
VGNRDNHSYFNYSNNRLYINQYLSVGKISLLTIIFFGVQNHNIILIQFRN